MKTEMIENLNREIAIPNSTIGVMSEAAAFLTGLCQIMYIGFPEKPLPPAGDCPGVMRVIGRTLTLLQPGESCTVRVSSAFTSSKRTVTNENGVAKVQRAGFTRYIIGPHVRYWRPGDSKPVKLR